MKKLLPIAVVAVGLAAGAAHGQNTANAAPHHSPHQEADDFLKKQIGSDTTAYISFSGKYLDIGFDLPSCDAASRAEFKSTLVRLLPAVLAKFPESTNIRVKGGCTIRDVYGKESHDADLITAMFMRDQLEKVVWDKVRPDDLFSKISFGRFE
jgi:hypothetical protein